MRASWNFTCLVTHSVIHALCRFNSMESAQRCIEGLRRCRNLHPSFSKVGQISTLGSLLNVSCSKFIGSLARNTLSTVLHSRSIRTRIPSRRAWRNLRTPPRPISISKGEPSSFRRITNSQDITRLPLSTDEEVSFYGTMELTR